MSGGTCHCGCGEPTPIARRTYAKKLIFRGQPLRYIQGHQMRGRRTQSVEERFWEKVSGSGDPSSCWTWIAARLPAGYGRFWITDDEWIVAHRWSYEQLIGPVPAELELDHLCSSRDCVNPWHLEPVTRAENTRRATEAKKERA